MVLRTSDIPQITNLLLTGKIGVMPTDTVYGIHCLAQNQALIQKIAGLKNRASDMPMITLVSSIEQLKEFDLKIGKFEQDSIASLWPGPNTLIFKTSQENTQSFRLPNNKFLIDVLSKTGPLISTSANLHGKPHAKNIQQAFEYFGNNVDFYVYGGDLENEPSNIYNVFDGRLEKVR